MGRTVMRDLIHHDESMSLSHRIEDKNTTTSFRATATVVIDDREHSPTNRTQITVGRPGLDPCTLGSKGTFKRLPCDGRSEEHTSELQSLRHLVCRLLL